MILNTDSAFFQCARNFSVIFKYLKY